MKPTSATVLEIFEEICQIPRPSKHEEQIRQYLLQFASTHQLAAQTDSAGNVLITKNGNTPGICLQAHMDMVCEKTPETRHDFLKDPIRHTVEDGWMHACGTTLGADDGIGMALALAALLSDSPLRLEALFTVDEETGLTGANALQAGWIQSPVLLNLDSEEDDEFIIGCAGGCETVARYTVKRSPLPIGMFGVKLKIKGLRGGHSGSDIHLHRANALLLLSRFLQAEAQKFEVRVVALSGGNLHNAIAREAEAFIAVPMRQKEQIRIDWNIYWSEQEDLWLADEPQMLGELESATLPNEALDEALGQALTDALAGCRHGVVAWSTQLPDIVETSTNLASVKPLTLTDEPEDGSEAVTHEFIEVCTSQRSSDEAELSRLAFEIYEHFSAHGAQPYITGKYSGWAPNFDSPLVSQAVGAYSRLFGQAPAVKVIHAGLECGVFRQIMPQLDMLSVGPTLRDVHTPSERLKIESVGKIWRLIGELIQYSSATV
ncbi:MAG: beta-Ala-His dipeptidase [Paludibacteraceae bacterium]|nr:beta-Ala-His dipeptidase [Paludibacteraceae bacterium]